MVRETTESNRLLDKERKKEIFGRKVKKTIEKLENKEKLKKKIKQKGVKVKNFGSKGESKKCLCKRNIIEKELQ